MGSKKKGNGRKRQRTEWLEVGELWAELQHNLERPNWRMPNFAKFEETTERKKEARKLAHEEQKAMYMARRFDVDQECADMIYNWDEMNFDGNWMEQVSGFYNVVLELQMPFESMWIEFPDKEGHVLGCLAKDRGDKFTFQLFKDTQSDVLAHDYRLDRFLADRSALQVSSDCFLNCVLRFHHLLVLFQPFLVTFSHWRCVQRLNFHGMLNL